MTDQEFVQKYHDLEKRIKQLEAVINKAETDDDWIKVQEKMPDEGEEVLIYCPEFLEEIRKAFYTEGDFYIEKEDLIVEPNPNGCTHWMPLPKPPRGENNVL